MSIERSNLEIIIYLKEDGKTKIDVTIENETIWLNQVQNGRVVSNFQAE